MTDRQIIAWLCLIALTVGGVQAARASQAQRQAAVPWHSARGHDKTCGSAQPLLDLVEYSDFQCPSCAYAFGVLHSFMEKYPQAVRVTFRHNPLEKPHAWAMTAAIAAECANTQGQFWPYHDVLLTRQAEWVKAPDPVATLKGYARELKLREGAFNTCLDEGQTMQVIRQEMEEGVQRGVRSTPTFYVVGNPQPIVGGNQLGERLAQVEAQITGRPVAAVTAQPPVAPAAVSPLPAPAAAPSPQQAAPTTAGSQP